MLLVFVSLALLLGITIIQWLITAIAGYFVVRFHKIGSLSILKETLYRTKTTKLATSGFSMIVLGFGMAQTIQFYLFNGVYFWLVILSFGLYLLLFILPWANLLLPYYKKMKILPNILFNMSTGTLLVWIILLMTTEKVLYTTTGELAGRANIPLKNMTIVLLILYYVLSLVWLILVNKRDYVCNERKEGGIALEKRTIIYTFQDKLVNSKLVMTGRESFHRWVTVKRIVLLFSVFPAIFIGMFLFIERFMNYPDMWDYYKILLFIAISPFGLGTISLLFLGNGKKWVRWTSLGIYTVLSVFNLLVTHMTTKYGFIILVDFIKEGIYFSLESYLLPIAQSGLYLLIFIAWLVPYLLLYKKRVPQEK